MVSWQLPAKDTHHLYRRKYSKKIRVTHKVSRKVQTGIHFHFTDTESMPSATLYLHLLSLAASHPGRASRHHTMENPRVVLISTLDVPRHNLPTQPQRILSALLSTLLPSTPTTSHTRDLISCTLCSAANGVRRALGHAADGVACSLGYLEDGESALHRSGWGVVEWEEL